MSAKTGVYETWKLLETIEQQATYAAQVKEQLAELVAQKQAIINEYDKDDPEIASDMGFTLQLSLLQTVLNLVQKERPPLLFCNADEAVTYLVAYFDNPDMDLIPLMRIVRQIDKLNKTILALLPKKEG